MNIEKHIWEGAARRPTSLVTYSRALLWQLTLVQQIRIVIILGGTAASEHIIVFSHLSFPRMEGSYGDTVEW